MPEPQLKSTVGLTKIKGENGKLIKLNDREYRIFVSFIREKFGVNLDGKRDLIESRLAYDIEKNGYNSFTNYIELLMANPTGVECQKMVGRITTNHTYFFREDEHFHHLQKLVIPELAKRLRTYELTIWSAASSSGQEVYSSAMVVDDAIKKMGLDWKWSILGSDISTNVLTKAKLGVYPVAEMEAIPKIYHSYCSIKSDKTTFEISPVLCKNISFRIQNLIEPFPYRNQFDVVFCRNVMIYFDNPTKEKLISALYQTIKPGGYLYVGTTESLGRRVQDFKYIAPAIYRKI